MTYRHQNESYKMWQDRVIDVYVIQVKKVHFASTHYRAR
jgi:hypothetical protein